MRLIALFGYLFAMAAEQGISDDFTGSITYRYTRHDNTGKIVGFPQEVETFHVSESKILVQIVSGQVKYILGYDLLLDLDRKARFEIYHADKMLSEVAPEQAHDLNFSHEEISNVAEVLKMPCRKVMFKRNHEHSADTITYTYYFNEKLTKNNLKEFAALQGNSSTLFLDGRFKMIPLKVEMRYPKGELITIEAINISHTLDASIFNYKAYKLINHK